MHTCGLIVDAYLWSYCPQEEWGCMSVPEASQETVKKELNVISVTPGSHPKLQCNIE